MGFNDAAVFYVASMTARYAVRDRARLKAGEILLVLGAGSGAGLAAVEVGKALGARVVAAASSEDKLALARQSGADACVRYERGPLDLAGQKSFAAELLRHAKRDTAAVQSVGKINTVHEDAGYHVIFDGVGGSYAEPALRALGWEGRYLSVGFAAGMAKVALGPALFKNADIMGIQPSSDALRMPGRNPEGIEVMLRWYAEGRLHPRITKVLPLADAAKGLRLMKDRKATGRIVLETPRAGT
jgi:NADPH2:quinone reductase